MPGIDHQSPVPLYFQLKQILEDKIRRRELKPGDRIPTEDELCIEYGISRTPVRQALLDLVRQGLLTRTAGRGTFVALPPSGDGTLQVVFSDERWQELLESATQRAASGQAAGPMQLSTRTVPLWDIHDYLASAVGRGEAPDISVLDSVWVAEFANQHYLVPLDEADPGWYRELERDIYPAMLSANRYRGRLWGMPLCGDASVLWYRRDWFAAEKLEPPTTWEELVAVASHFQKEEVRSRYGLDRYPLVFVGGRRGGETTTYQLLPLVWAAGGRIVEDGQVVLDSAAARRALSFLHSLVHEHCLAPAQVVDYTWDYSAQVFAAGRAALAFGGTYENFFIRQLAGWEEADFLERVGFVPIPAGPGGEPATLVGGMNFVLYRQSGSLPQALDLLKTAVDPQVLLPFCENTGQIPARISVANALRQAGKGFVSQTVSLLERARTRPSLPGFARVSAQFRGLVEDCLTGRRPVDQAISLAAERISAITDLPLG